MVSGFLVQQGIIFPAPRLKGAACSFHDGFQRYSALDSGAAPTSGAERRANPRVRAVFEKACRVTAPFFDGEQAASGFTSNLSLHRALREDFPELPQQDIPILLSAVKAYYTARARPQA